MKNKKMDKGITLVALMITIVLLIILASVAISSISNEDIIAHTSNMTDAYNNKVVEENDTLKNYGDYMGNQLCNHEWGESITQPTCIGTGVKSVVCTKCGAILSGEEIDALGHDYTDNHVAQEHLKEAATCTTAAVYYVSCKRCDLNSTNTFTSGSALGHNWDSGKTTKSPTCTAKGEIIYTCKRCGDTRKEDIDELGHLMDNGTITILPTCTTEGEETYSCTRSGCNYAETKTIPALGHLMDSGIITTSPTCTTEGEETYSCTRSGCDYYETKIILALGHLISDTGTIIETATCTSQGKVRLECERTGCDYEIDTNTDKDTNNHVGGWTTTQTATCAARGRQRCNGCGGYKYISKDSTNHTGPWNVTKEATCISKGTKECDGCGATKSYSGTHKKNSYISYDDSNGTDGGHYVCYECVYCGVDMGQEFEIHQQMQYEFCSICGDVYECPCGTWFIYESYNVTTESSKCSRHR